MLPEPSLRFVAARLQRLEGIRKERAAHQLVEDLANCGVRPTVIYLVIGRQLSRTEVIRIHKSVTPIPASARHGRNQKAENIEKISQQANDLFLRCFELVRHSIVLGAQKAEALVAAWRVCADSHGVEPHEEIGGVNCEEMISVYLNHNSGELTVQECMRCSALFLSFKGLRCMRCESLPKRMRAAA